MSLSREILLTSSITKDPTLFRGSLRSNLDPHSLFTDEQILTSLRLVNLVGSSSKPSQPLVLYLDGPLPPFSLSQRQLLCLARALLREPKILVLDEATASIDHVTEQKVWEVVKYIQCTVIIITHRLRNVDDCDKIFVMSAGKIVEIGAVEELKERAGGRFREMLEDQEEMAGVEDDAVPGSEQAREE